MKIALIHDYIKEYGGAERVLEALHELYPDAPVFTTVYLPEYLGPHKERFKNWDIRTSFLQKIPFKAKLISPFRLLSTLAFKSFDFSGYDVVIVSATGAYFPNSIKTKSVIARKSPKATDKAIPKITNGDRHATLAMTNSGAIHVCYCHTPPRYLYGYATAREWKKNIVFRILGEVANHFLRMVDFNSAQNVDCFIANSEEVKARIHKFYRKDAKVIYPPVEIKKVSKVSEVSKVSKDYYLAGGRLARAKHVDLIIQACQELDISLKVFGKGFAGYDRNIKNQISNIKDTNQKSKIEYTGEVGDEEKFELMKGAKAYIFAGEDEDFGILPVEAMAAGIPVIAYKSGGVKETVVDGGTGIFFNELTVDSLKDAIKRFEKMKFDPALCRKQAERFSRERFLEEVKDFITKINTTNRQINKYYA